ncbi:DUF4129 domain-containing protein [Demequina sp. NBRC 110052]|uniref:DUF4129 domain-containing protein n=1 Tax=Demequina sp. NBRC 110052 TaxID=1570341 RepID=UPI0009FC5270|nr:DUF4129 domain-containing protein [Demequina sp. NBRC 110052]
MILALLPLAPPVEPGADEARRWAEDELSKADYAAGASLMDRIAQALTDFLADLLSGEGSGSLEPLGYVLALLAVIAVLGGAFAIARPLLAARRRERSDVMEDETRSATELDAAARTAAAAERWHDAVVDGFRAIVRSAEERALIDPRPGRTAHEAAWDAGVAVPDAARALHAASRTFDEVRYSDVVATRAHYETVRAASEALALARPAVSAAQEPTP